MSGSFVISTSIATGETMSTRQNLQPAPRFESGNELAVTREAMEASSFASSWLCGERQAQ
jgi:hypothetical protein